MEVTLGNLFLAFEAIQTLLSAKLPIKTAYALHKAIAPISAELNQLESMRLRLLENHTKDGEIDRDEFMAEYNSLLSTTVDLPLPTIPISEILDSDVKITSLGINILITIGILSET